MPRRVAVALAVAALLLGGCSSDDPGGSDTDPRGELALSAPRAVHRATLLSDGSVLLTGGCSEPGCGGFEASRTADVFDPVTRSFDPGSRMLSARASGTATLLPDGRVLLVGGYPGEGMAPIPDAEIYDPRSGGFSPVGSLETGRAAHSATLLADGSVLVAGGFDPSGTALSSTEVFDPADSTFSPGPPMSGSRGAHVAVAVGSRVVLVGGTNDRDSALRSTDVLEGNHWDRGPDLAVARVKMGAARIDADRLLVVGGSEDEEGHSTLSSTEVVDVARDIVRPGPDLPSGQYKLDGAVEQLQDGRIVIAGGDALVVYDPETEEIVEVAEPRLAPMSFRTATPLGASEVLVVGGYDGGIVPTRSAAIVEVPPRP